MKAKLDWRAGTPFPEETKRAFRLMGWIAGLVVATVAWDVYHWNYCSGHSHAPGFCVDWVAMGTMFPMLFWSILLNRFFR